METLLITLAPLPRGSGPALRARLTTLLNARPNTTTVVCDVSALTHPTPADLDHLAHLRLASRRAGRDLVLRSPTTRLQLLLELTGLAAEFEQEPDAQP